MSWQKNYTLASKKRSIWIEQFLRFRSDRYTFAETRRGLDVLDSPLLLVQNHCVQRFHDYPASFPAAYSRGHAIVNLGGRQTSLRRDRLGRAVPLFLPLPRLPKRPWFPCAALVLERLDG